MIATPVYVLEVSNLEIRLATGTPIVEGVSLRVAPGEILGIVGESGSGKTTTAMAILGYSRPGVVITDGDVRVAGQSLLQGRAAKRARGKLVSYVPQNSGGALNPSMRIATEIRDMIDVHRSEKNGAAGVTRLLAAVGLPTSDEFKARYPHQLSGGQQQRVCIAVSLAADPLIVVLDEPTTGLDVVTQSRILTELQRLRDEQNLAMVYVTHDLSVVAQIADRIAVMYAGTIVEEGPVEKVLRRPRHPYTRGLIASIPDHLRPRRLQPMPGIAVGIGERPAGCSFEPRCSQRVQSCAEVFPALEEVAPGHAVRCSEWTVTRKLDELPLQATAPSGSEDLVAVLAVRNLRAEHRSRREHVVAADDVSFVVPKGACVALVGESGSGKTTIARAIAGLHPIASGEVVLHGTILPSLARRRTIDQRRRVQLVFQNPADSLNPRHTIRATIERPARKLGGLSPRAADAEVARLLECVRLPARVADRYPAELSGGERQRVAIARALATGPEIIVCDEVTSSLDVSVQAAVLTLLNELRRDLGLGLLFITHDIGVVATVADRVLVLEHGIVCEQGPTAQVLEHPRHPYAQRLVGAAPSLTAALDAWSKGPTNPEQESVVEPWMVNGDPTAD